MTVVATVGPWTPERMEVSTPATGAEAHPSAVSSRRHGSGSSHPLLRRQLERHAGKIALGRWQPLLDAVNAVYVEADDQRQLLERAIDLSSRELVQANAELRGVLNALPDQLFRITAAGKIVGLTCGEASLQHLPVRRLDPVLRSGASTGERDLWEVCQEVRRTGTPRSFEYQVVDDRQKRYFEARVLPFVDSDVIGIVRDISLAKLSENALRDSEAKLRRAKIELEIEREKLRHQALHDALTGLPNRRLLYDRARQAIRTARRGQQPMALLVMDLDRFKHVNDTLGHHAGDTLLQQVSARLSLATREADTVARLGGDEFAILLAQLGDAGSRDAATSATIAAERILEALRDPFPIADTSIKVEASVGIALYPEHGQDVDLLLRRGDMAMYAAKERAAGWSIYAVEGKR